MNMAGRTRIGRAHCSLVLAMRTTPHDRHPDHVGLHAVTVVDDGQLDRLFVRGGPVITEEDIDTIGVRLDSIVDQLRDRVTVTAIAEIADASDKCLRHHQAELRAPAVLPGICVLRREDGAEARAPQRLVLNRHGLRRKAPIRIESGDPSI